MENTKTILSLAPTKELEERLTALQKELTAFEKTRIAVNVGCGYDNVCNYLKLKVENYEMRVKIIYAGETIIENRKKENI